MKPYYEHAGITIYHGDCREVLQSLPVAFCRACKVPLVDESILAIHLAAKHDIGPFVGAVVSDPPYGMKRHGRYQTGANSDSHNAGDKSSRFGETVFGDDEPFDPSHLLGFEEVILWGLNHFPQFLSKGSVLIWLKRYDDAFGSFLSDAELAWFNRGCGVYAQRDLSLQGESSVRLHPSQKPIGIMKWCVGLTKSATVLDPYMGSGTTLEAAKLLGKSAIGIEIEEKYCEIAAKRLSQEVFTF